MSSVEVQGDTLDAMFVLSLIMYLLFSADRSSHYMRLFIRSLQLSVYLPLFNLLLQANFINFFNIVRPLLQFELFDIKLFEDMSSETFIDEAETGNFI